MLCSYYVLRLGGDSISYGSTPVHLVWKVAGHMTSVVVERLLCVCGGGNGD